jgi:hypothetical protein
MREFANQKALIDYAGRNGLVYLWKDAFAKRQPLPAFAKRQPLLSPAFAKRQRLLSRDQYEIVNVHTSRGLRRAMLFPKAILQAEFEVEPPSVMDRAPKKLGRHTAAPFVHR